MIKLLNIFLCLLVLNGLSQTVIFKDKGKWGIKEKENIIVPAVHDSVFNFDSTGKVCMVCARTRGAHPNKYIKTPVFAFTCQYLNKKGEKLVVRQTGADTSSIFAFHKYTPAAYQGNNNLMTVEAGTGRHLVDKDFNQITFKGYDEVHYSSDPNFIVAGKRNEGHTLLLGLVNLKEEEIIPFKYSNVKVNPKDSLIIGCTAGLGPNSEDDIYNYEGKKLSSSHKHIELATKNYVVHRIFVPKEYLLIINYKNKEERQEFAEEVRYFSDEELLMVNDGHWFTYNVVTHKKKAYDPKKK